MKIYLFPLMLFIFNSMIACKPTLVEEEQPEDATMDAPLSEQALEFNHILEVMKNYTDKDLAEYHNPRFDFLMAYPTEFIMEVAPQNGDGNAFHSPDSLAHITLSGSNDNYETTLADYYNFAQENINVTYKVIKENAFVVSGTYMEDGTEFISYSKTKASNTEAAGSHFLTFQISYPKAQKQQYDYYCRLINEVLNF